MNGRTGVAVCGVSGCGKTTASKFLADTTRGLVSAGSVVREYCMTNGFATDRPTLQKVGSELAHLEGGELFANMLARKSFLDKEVVFDGIRRLPILHKLRKSFDAFYIIYIHCSPQILDERLARRRDLYIRSFNDILTTPIERDALDIRKAADIEIVNDGILTELEKVIMNNVAPVLFR